MNPLSKTLLLLLTAICFGFCSAATVSADESDDSKVEIGSKIEGLIFKDRRYLPRTLDEFEKKDVIVIVCVNTSCPIVQQYIPKLKRLDEKYRDQNVQFIAINTRADDSILEIAAHAVEFDIPFPVVKDIDANCVTALGVLRTPEVVVLDSQRKLRYRGRIDNQYRLGGARPQATKEPLQEAIDAVLAGEEVAVTETSVDGCAITLPAETSPRTDLTYADDIKPLVRAHCVECHQPGTEAPFALVTYRDVAKQGEMLAEVVEEQRMPPWYASPSHNEFVNKRGMTSKERRALIQWVKAGMPAGEIDESEHVVTQDDSVSPWLIGEPDKIITMAETHTIQAEGYVDYKYVVLPYVFTHDTWIQGMQILPDNTRVVHHCNLLGFPATEGFKKAYFITGKVPGSPPVMLDGTGIAVHIPKGSMLGFQIHYTTTGKEETSKISLGLRYYRGIVKKKFRNVLVADYDFKIPPGDGHHRVTNTQVLDEDVTGIGLFSHMHLRGKDMSFYANYPDGEEEHLLTVPNYSFDWQLPYRWAPQTKKFPKGTEIEVVAHYDNSEFNPYNPDPTDTVVEGRQTYHEMFNGFFFYTVNDEELNIQVDPKTGKGEVVTDAAALESAEKQVE